MTHRVQVNTDEVVIDNIPYNSGDVAIVEDEAFGEIPAGMFTSGRLTDLGEEGGGAGLNTDVQFLDFSGAWHGWDPGPVDEVDFPNTDESTGNGPFMAWLTDGATNTPIGGLLNFTTDAGAVLSDEYMLSAGVGSSLGVQITKAGLYYVTVLAQWTAEEGDTGHVGVGNVSVGVALDHGMPWQNLDDFLIGQKPDFGAGPTVQLTYNTFVYVVPQMVNPNNPPFLYIGAGHTSDGTLSINASAEILRVS